MKYFLLVFVWPYSSLLWAAEPSTKFKYTDWDGRSCEAQYNAQKYSFSEIENASYFTYQLDSRAALRSLNLCNKNLDPKYKDCGERRYSATYFLHNAKVNLDANEIFLAANAVKSVPSEFAQIKLQILQDFQISQRIYQTIYEYLKSRNSSILENAKFDGLDSKACLSHLRSLSASASKDFVERIVIYEWYNCINRLHKPLVTQAFAVWKKLIINNACLEPEEDRD